MTEQAKEARRAYKRKWAKENPDKIRAQQERYWNKKAKKHSAGSADNDAGTKAPSDPASAGG